MAREVEIKLLLDRPEDAVSLLGALGLDAGKPVVLDATYYDTPDGMLAKAGLSLRIRREAGRRVQTVKQMRGAGAGLFERLEEEEPRPRGGPTIASGGPLARLLGPREQELAPQWRVVTYRRHSLLLAGGAQIELAHDVVRVEAGELGADFVEIELELKSGDGSALFDLVRRIGQLTPVRLGVLAKVEHAQRLTAPCPVGGDADKAAKLRLPRDTSVSGAFRAIVRGCVRHYRLNETRLLAGQNGEALHQCRVALRRLRSALAVFRPILGGKAADRLAQDLKWLTNQLGDARNIDALLAMVRDPAARAKLCKAREPAYAAALFALRSQLARDLMLDLIAWVELGGWDHGADDRPARDFAARAIAKRHRRLVALAGAVTGTDDERRHSVRKTAKKLRYAVEFFADLFDRKGERRALKRYLSALEALQDHLGALNDLAVMPDVLHGLGMAEEGLTGAEAPGRRDRLLLMAGDAMAALHDAKPFWD